MSSNNQAKFHVQKFGGSSLANAGCFRAIQQQLSTQPQAIVVSAVQGTTNALQALLDQAKNQQDYQLSLQQLQQKHQQIAQQLLESNSTTFEQLLQNDIDKLDNLLKSVTLISDYDPSLQAFVLGFGELWSANLLTQYLNQTTKTSYLDASKVLHVFQKHGKTQVDWQKSQQAMDQFLAQQTITQLVITGFIACDAQGRRTILQRNSSDYSAAIFAKLLVAKTLTIWTDVNGVYSADPRKVPSAFSIPELSYAEALELAYFGANILHPQTIGPAMEYQIPITIRNSFDVDQPGTCITQRKQQSKHLICGLSSITDVVLVNIEGSGMIGVSGTSARVFQTLFKANISVILISQASSEHSICFVVEKSAADETVKLLEETFCFELQQKQIRHISVDQDCAILAVVGDGMVGKPGIAGRLCETLSKVNINIRAIAQGSSERNISVVLKQNDINKALRAVHAGFYLSTKSISIGLIGPGLIGATLLKQIEQNQQRLQKGYQVNLRVRGIINSKKMLTSDKSLDLTQWETQFKQAEKANLKQFVQQIAGEDIPHAVIIDCTANAELAKQYEYFIQHGLHIITPNKKANSGDFNYCQQLQQQAKKLHRYYLYETTVCAGLPVIKTLQDLIQTGDTILSIEGVVSGTLAYIFYQLSQGKSFSEAVLQAKKLGYTEPDPRDDLSGTDVARKMVCLAREMGYQCELSDVEVHNLVPEALREVSATEFIEKLPQFDQMISEQINSIVSPQDKPAYIGHIDQHGKISVDIKAISPQHPLFAIKGTDNMIVYRTKRYHDYPLIIQGPGAGAEVTAAGVFADLLRLASLLEN